MKIFYLYNIYTLFYIVGKGTAPPHPPVITPEVTCPPHPPPFI